MPRAETRLLGYRGKAREQKATFHQLGLEGALSAPQLGLGRCKLPNWTGVAVLRSQDRFRTFSVSESHLAIL